MISFKDIKVNRCEECKKIICKTSKNNLCNYHSKIRKLKESRHKKCSICKKKCSGKLLIKLREGAYFSLCDYHYSLLPLDNNRIKIIRKIRLLKTIRH